MDLICGKPVFPQRFFFRLQLPSKAPTALTWSDFLTNCQLAVGAWLAPQRCLTHALFCTHLYYIIISQPAAAWSSRCNFYPVLVSWRRRDHRRHRKDRFCWTARAKMAAFPTSWTAGWLHVICAFLLPWGNYCQDLSLASLTRKCAQSRYGLSTNVDPV